MPCKASMLIRGCPCEAEHVDPRGDPARPAPTADRARRSRLTWRPTWRLSEDSGVSATKPLAERQPGSASDRPGPRFSKSGIWHRASHISSSPPFAGPADDIFERVSAHLRDGG